MLVVRRCRCGRPPVAAGVARHAGHSRPIRPVRGGARGGLGDGRRAGLRELLAGWCALARRPVWLAVSLLLLPATMLGAIVLYSRIHGTASPLLFRDTWATLPVHFVYTLLLCGPLGEEPGWRGFALPRLQARHGPLAASFWLGLLWAGWHLPLWFIYPAPCPFAPVRGGGDPHDHLVYVAVQSHGRECFLQLALPCLPEYGQHPLAGRSRLSLLGAAACCWLCWGFWCAIVVWVSRGVVHRATAPSRFSRVRVARLRRTRPYSRLTIFNGVPRSIALQPLPAADLWRSPACVGHIVRCKTPWFQPASVAPTEAPGALAQNASGTSTEALKSYLGQRRSSTLATGVRNVDRVLHPAVRSRLRGWGARYFPDFAG